MKRCTTTVRTLRVRIKDKHAKALAEMARAVNLTWNYCNELSMKVFERERRYIGSAELQRYLKGASKEGLAVGAAVFQQVAEEYVTRRMQHKRRRLAWRKSNGARRSLGWIPFKKRSLLYRNGQLRFQGLTLSVWDSHGVGAFELGGGSISEDARGRWYLNVTVMIPSPEPQAGKSAIGIDLGLKDFAAFSDEAMDKVEAHRFFRGLEPALAAAQRAGKKDRTKAIHAKIANRRKDALHKLSTSLVRNHGAIFVGNVSASAMTQNGNAKSVLDAGWAVFRTMLQYKCDDAGVWFEEVNEAYSTQTCSACGSITGPKGREGLAVRRWVCGCCGSEHDRDVNAAKNILRVGMHGWRQQPSGAEAKAEEPSVNEAVSAAGLGHEPLAGGIPAL